MTGPFQNKTFLISKESTWGTAVAPTKDIGIVRDVNDELTREVVESQGGGSIAVQQINQGILEVGHGLTVEFQHGRLLEFAFGTVAHATTNSDEKHTFTINNNAPSFTAQSSENNTTDSGVQTTGNLVESLEVSTELNDVLLMTVALKGKTPTAVNTAGAAVNDTLIVFPHPMVIVKLNAVQATEATPFSITIEKELAFSDGVGSVFHQQGHAVSIKFKFAGTLGFTDNTFQNLFIGGSTASATANPAVYDVLLNAHNSMTLGTGRRELYLELENCMMTKHNKVAAVGSLIFVDIEGTGTLKSCFSVDDIASGSW